MGLNYKQSRDNHFFFMGECCSPPCYNTNGMDMIIFFITNKLEESMKDHKTMDQSVIKFGGQAVKKNVVSNIAKEAGSQVKPLEGDLKYVNNDRQHPFVTVPKVTHLEVEAAHAYLTTMGFEVVKQLDYPHAKYRHLPPGAITCISPKSGTNVAKGQLVTLFYVNQAIIKKSQRLKIEFHNVEGLRLDRAVDHLESLGLQVKVCLLQSHKKHHRRHADTVIKMVPKPNVFKTRVRGDKIIKLYILDESAI